YNQSAAPNATADGAVLSTFHILNQFDIPKGSVVNSAAGEKMDKITEWTRRRSQEPALVFPHIRGPIDPHGRSQGGRRRGQGRDRTIEMEGTKQPIADVSSDTTTKGCLTISERGTSGAER